YAAKPHPERRLGSWRIDLPARRIIGPDGEITLTRQEWALLETFLLYPRKIHSRASLEEKLYSYGGEAESNTVEVYVSRLRRKLGAETIVTQRGIGYRLGESLS
ncbi:MAG: winged helix-turn-helix domain-containing protein, partial [Rhodospirillaceae bacterium]|nr:winged helix-turn-helix domain-containing protein [Rhodospirillaceae bacterium]